MWNYAKIFLVNFRNVDPEKLIFFFCFVFVHWTKFAEFLWKKEMNVDRMKILSDGRRFTSFEKLDQRNPLTTESFYLGNKKKTICL